jgi:hypothetical protein
LTIGRARSIPGFIFSTDIRVAITLTPAFNGKTFFLLQTAAPSTQFILQQKRCQKGKLYGISSVTV